MSGNREETFLRLKSAQWVKTKEIINGLVNGNASLQRLSQGAGEVVHDEYSIMIERMPPNKTAESFLHDMAKDLNGIVNNKSFDNVNIFQRRSKNPPKVGDIVDIDILGPDNGSVILAEMKTSFFIFQTVKTVRCGEHPEFGSREFGFERLGSRVKFYTRGVSRPGNIMVGIVGSGIQKKGWRALVTGIGNTIQKQGGLVGPINVFVQKR